MDNFIPPLLDTFRPPLTAATDPKKRPLKWIACAWVEEFVSYYGTPNNHEYKKEIENNLTIYCTEFLKTSSKGKSISEITPTDFIRGCRWEEKAEGVFNNVSIKKVFETTGLKSIYETYYANTSNWVHWNPIGIAEALKPGSAVPTYGKETKYLGAIGYISGFKCFLQSAKFLNGYFKLEFDKALDTLEKDFDANSGPTT